MLRYVVLCCAMLCYIGLCCVMLDYFAFFVVVYCGMSCNVVSCCPMLKYLLLSCAMLSSVGRLLFCYVALPYLKLIGIKFSRETMSILIDKILNKHAPFKTLSKRRIKQLSKRDKEPHTNIT